MFWGPEVSQLCHYVWVPCLGPKGCKWFDICIWNFECPPRYFPSLPPPRHVCPVPTLTPLPWPSSSYSSDLALTFLNVFWCCFSNLLGLQVRVAGCLFSCSAKPDFSVPYGRCSTLDISELKSLLTSKQFPLLLPHFQPQWKFAVVIWYSGKFLMLRGYVSRSEDRS